MSGLKTFTVVTDPPELVVPRNDRLGRALEKVKRTKVCPTCSAPVTIRQAIVQIVGRVSGFASFHAEPTQPPVLLDAEVTIYCPRCKPNDELHTKGKRAK